MNNQNNREQKEAFLRALGSYVTMNNQNSIAAADVERPYYPPSEPVSFPMYGVNCQIVEKLNHDGPTALPVARIGYLGPMKDDENLSLRARGEIDGLDQIAYSFPADEKTAEGASQFRTIIAATRFHVVDGVLCCVASTFTVGLKPFILVPFEGTVIDSNVPKIDFAGMVSRIAHRNEEMGFVTPPELLSVASLNTGAKTIESASEFSFHTSQEMDALYGAQCNGKTFTGYMINVQAGAIVHEMPRSPHRVQLALTDDERDAGLALTYLENMVRSQDADAMIATSYILRVLAPPPHLPPRPYAGGWIDFDDVIKKISWDPRSTDERRVMHAKIWNFVKFGERAQIIGKRTGKYQIDGEEINTTIHGAAWRVMKTETADQPTLYAALETPVRAEIVVSRELTALLTHPKTAQYLQGAEIIGAIPGGKPAGAWARVIGAALFTFWRRKPREHKAEILKPTRRELLDRYAAKITPYQEILESKNPTRAIEYWCDALQILADGGFIARSGEAAISAKEMRDALPRQNWQKEWLDQAVNIEVGAALKAAFDERVAALPALKPRDLKKKARAKKKPK